MYQVFKTRPPERAELIFESEDLERAENYRDERNTYLRLAGIPSSVCFWFIKGPDSLH
jgi:hypothetical protein